MELSKQEMEFFPPLPGIISKKFFYKMFLIFTKGSKLIFKTGNGTTQTGNGIFLPIYRPWIKKLPPQLLPPINKVCAVSPQLILDLSWSMIVAQLVSPSVALPAELVMILNDKSVVFPISRRQVLYGYLGKIKSFYSFLFKCFTNGVCSI